MLVVKSPAMLMLAVLKFNWFETCKHPPKVGREVVNVPVLMVPTTRLVPVPFPSKSPALNVQVLGNIDHRASRCKCATVLDEVGAGQRLARSVT